MSSKRARCLNSSRFSPRKPGGGGGDSITAIRISIFHRKGSRYWQALIVWGNRRKRVTTRTTIKASALEYAQLAYRHYSSESRKPGFIDTFPPKRKPAEKL